MKAARIHSFGGPEVISVEEAPLPTVSAAEDVLVQVYAAGVNPIDWLFRNGFGKDMFHHGLPLTLGCDVSGVDRGRNKGNSGNWVDAVDAISASPKG